jgi:hypothetical protein
MASPCDRRTARTYESLITRSGELVKGLADGGAILIVAMEEKSVNDSTAFDFARTDRTS